MKSSKAATYSREHKIPELRFDDGESQKLTSFAGLIVYQKLFADLDLRKRLRDCFAHRRVEPIYGFHRIALLLIIHVVLGYRKLRDRDFYDQDPMVLRTLGLKRLPDTSTISRALKSVDRKSVDGMSTVMSDMVVDRLRVERVRTLTLDFDGSVISTTRHAEGTAVGYNKMKKGRRSYYPLFCTVAQTGQFFDVLHRSGNVHDSNGSVSFVRSNMERAREIGPGMIIESRFDSAFFNEEMLSDLDHEGAQFTASVPFERFTELKRLVEERSRWCVIDGEWSYFECDWKPKKWDDKFRFIFVRRKNKKQISGPLQLDLFEPRSHEYAYKVIVTNKKIGAKKVLNFHNGRGEQEGIFAEGKSNGLDYIPVKTWNGNRMYCLAVMMAHNLTREIQMRYQPKDRSTTEKRTPIWIFKTLDTIRQRVVQRAGRLVRPSGRLTLVMGGNLTVRKEIEKFMDGTG